MDPAWIGPLDQQSGSLPIVLRARLHEDLPIKWPDKSFKANNIFPWKRQQVQSVNYPQKFFLVDKYRLKIYVFSIQHIGYGKSVFRCFPRDQTNPFAYSCSFIIHTP